MKDLSAFSIKELLGMAIKAEIDSNEAYSHLQVRVENPILKDKFQLLSSEEKKHQILLERFFDTLYHNEEIPLPDEKTPVPLPQITLDPSTPFVDILFQAMNSEKESQQFYLDLSQKFEGEKRSILEYLSKVEGSHYTLLKSEYEMAQEFEDYDKMKEFDKVVT